MPINKAKERMDTEKQRLLSDCEEKIVQLKKDMEQKANSKAEELTQDEEQLSYLELKLISLKKM